RFVVGNANRIEALVGTQEVSIDAGVGLQRARQQLVEVALALPVQAALADVTDFEGRVETKLALKSSVPGPRFRISKDRVLSRDVLREGAIGATARVVHTAISDRSHWLERRVTAEEDRVAHAYASHKASRACADHVLVVKRIRNADARLEVPFVDFRIRFADPTEEEVELARAGHGHTPRSFGGVGETVARND